MLNRVDNQPLNQVDILQDNQQVGRVGNLHLSHLQNRQDSRHRNLACSHHGFQVYTLLHTQRDNQLDSQLDNHLASRRGNLYVDQLVNRVLSPPRSHLRNHLLSQ